MSSPNPDLPPELRPVAEMLERQRPQMGALELDRIKRVAIARTSSPRRNFMRSRLAIVSMLVAGLLMSSGGAALGISSLTSTGSASQAQYGGPPERDVLGDSEEGGNGDSGSRPRSETQSTRQVSTPASAGLPFTGYASIPVLILGLALLSTGLVLRRSVRAGRDA